MTGTPSGTYRYRDVAKRRAYMRDYMRRRRARLKQEKEREPE